MKTHLPWSCCLLLTLVLTGCGGAIVLPDAA